MKKAVFKKESTKTNLTSELITKIQTNEEPESAYIISSLLEFYGVSSTGDSVKIGEAAGYLVFIGNLVMDGWEPVEICDEYSADLAFVMFSLEDVINKNPMQNMFYISRLEIEPEYSGTDLREEILQSLGDLLHEHSGSEVHMLTYIPALLPGDDENARHNILQKIKIDKLEGKEDGDIVSFSKKYRFTGEDVDILMNRDFYNWNQPKERRDREEYDFFIKNGYLELENGLLYRQEIKVDEF